jgi:hypothetical protein
VGLLVGFFDIGAANDFHGEIVSKGAHWILKNIPDVMPKGASLGTRDADG